MDQIKIGALLKDLRKERNLTQEQIADKFGVSQRSVSRWENGNTMPDISILIELADFYDVDLREILKGERKAVNMNEDMKETLEMVADYNKEEKKRIAKSLLGKICVCAAAFLVLAAIILFNLGSNLWWRRAAELCFTVQFLRIPSADRKDQQEIRRQSNRCYHCCIYLSGTGSCAGGSLHLIFI